MPSLFGPDERKYQQYAAALAATEPLRKERDAKAKQCLKLGEHWWLARRGKLGSSSGKGVCDLAVVDPQGRNHNLRGVCQQHVRTMSAVIVAMGLSPKEFNELSREVAGDPGLRSRVMEQAYYYRVAAQLSGGLLDQAAQLGPGGGGSDDEPRYSQNAAKKRKLTAAEFAGVAASVERLRSGLVADVKRELGSKATALPEGICGKAYLPVLNPKVLRLCAAFPEKATALVQSQGVSAASFNAVLTTKNPLLKWRIKRILKNEYGAPMGN